MDLVSWFGGRVADLARRNPARARALLLAGYRAELLAVRPPFVRRDLPPARRYAASEVTRLILAALADPHNAALVSLFVPCEPLFAAGVTPYSLEAISGYLMGAHCEVPFQEQAAERGVPETLCSFHRTFLGAAESGLLPRPRMIVYTSLACDGNMVTFPHLQQRYGAPCYFLDVPYEKTEDAVQDVARQLRGMVEFVQDVTGRPVTEEALRAGVARSRRSGEQFQRYLAAEAERQLPGDATGEMYAAFMSHNLLGSQAGETFFSRLAGEIAAAPRSRARRLLWLHVIPYMQPALRTALNFSDSLFVPGCDLCYDSLLIPQDENDPYGSMARRLVYSGFNGSPDVRIARARELAAQTHADGVVLFAHWGCKSTLGATQLIKTALEADGLPTLVLDGDACCPANTGDGQLATRMQAFLELLEARG